MAVRSTIVIENLSARQGGGQTYLANLLNHLPADVAEQCRIIVIAPEFSTRKISNSLPIEILSPAAPQKGVIQRLVWQKLALPDLLRKVGADVVYCPGGTLSIRPSGSPKTAVAFRNMIPFASSAQWRYPPGYQRLRNFLLRRAQGWSFRQADAVIFISAYAKTVIDAAVPKRRGRSEVIPHGIGELFRTKARAPRDLVGEGDYCLYVSKFDVYKAHLEVVEAWAQVREQRETPEKLVLVGPGDNAYKRKVEAMIVDKLLEDEVRILDGVPYEELPALYQHAKLNIFASACENCPNILLEALASGRPVLCSDVPPMPEFGGNAVAYFDPYRPDELAARILDLIDDAAAQERMSEAALRQAARFDWQESAKRTWNLLSSLSDTN